MACRLGPAPNTAEAKLGAAVCALCEALDVQTLLVNVGQLVDARVSIDLAAATCIIEKCGLAESDISPATLTPAEHLRQSRIGGLDGYT